MESPKWGEGKAPNERKGKPKLEEGRRIQSEKRKTNSGTKTKEIQLKNAEIGMPKWGEGKAQTGGREKSSCTATPSGLMPGSSMKRSEYTCWRFQLCALFSTFNEHFCHNLPWKENSPVLGPSFSRPSSQEGRGTWLYRPLFWAYSWRNMERDLGEILQGVEKKYTWGASGQVPSRS